jgi:hypothetical protein
LLKAHIHDNWVILQIIIQSTTQHKYLLEEELIDLLSTPSAHPNETFSSCSNLQLLLILNKVESAGAPNRPTQRLPLPIKGR